MGETFDRYETEEENKVVLFISLLKMMTDSITTEMEWPTVLQCQLFHLGNINTLKKTGCPQIIPPGSVKSIEFWKAKEQVEVTCDWMKDMEN